MPNSKAQRKSQAKNIAGPVRYFIVIFVLFGSILFGAIGVLYHFEEQDYLERIQLEEQINLKLQVKLLEERFDAVISDLLFLAQENELQDLMNSGGHEAKQGLAQEYLKFATYKAAYDQIRYLDENGTEVVRINFNQGSPAVVSEDGLQNKGGRYYFQETVALDPGEIYVSPFDLNIENGVVERPLKPMIRFGVPVFDRNGINRGIVILNYLGSRLIDLLRESAQLSPGNIMLVNSDGYWLCSPLPDDEWGFMLAGREGKTFPSRFPQAWEQISDTDSCQIYTQNGLFTLRTIYPLQGSQRTAVDSAAAPEWKRRISKNDDYFWKVVSHISRNDLNSGISSPLKTKRLVTVAVLLLLSAIPAWIISQAIVRRRRSRIELYHSANFDNLTQLPNRALFMDRMTQALRESKRYEQQFALLFVDLDGFKSINDTLGHDAGDELLELTAARLSSCVRESDTVARIGGDEFAVILRSITADEDAKRVARKINERVSSPFTIKNCERQIGASIGISFYPEHGDQVDTLLNKADAAMYAAKKSGKNDFRIST